ncbi:Tyrosine-protein kinase [Parasponia andersonii]|uniref:Tyrosine-protein kinase n=1 Tax=Parasponia andersonii TaxID=3476 RepID=A0A2P5BMD8_PARAD|nr:Tyrosine-protein kinase [Parasponia andersonii]
MLLDIVICDVYSGYMAPEYAIDGQYSVKSDVFSFGILMLEIVSGKKNSGVYHPNHDNLHLIGQAWEFWKEGRPLELTDEFLHSDSFTESEVLRCIHVGLLCVQQLPQERPNMSSVLLMLGDESALPQPKEPSFFLEKRTLDGNTSSSTNDFTISLLQPR